jgi:vacuolar-type H+-ATPase subunit D/Vma8
LPTQESVVIPSIIKKFKNEFENYSQLVNSFDHNIVIPKIQDFDEKARQFVYEENPKEFA